MEHNVRKPPLFPIPMWNSHKLTKDHLPRTNNNVEAWHKVFTDTIGHCRPSIYKLILALINEQGKTEFTINELNYRPAKIYSKPKYEKSNAKLENLIMEYKEYAGGDMDLFLSCCSYYIDIQV